jgi:integrative and conjugative element protein (TIGR02256 family)
MTTSREVLEVFNKYKQDTKEKTEAGGILLGSRRGPHFEIVLATEPTKHDKRSRYHFERSPKVHNEIALEIWRRTNGHTTYLGEWHTHPQVIPSPSVLDISEWDLLTKKQNKPFSMVIVGIEQLCVGISSPDGSLNKLEPTN